MEKRRLIHILQTLNLLVGLVMSLPPNSQMTTDWENTEV